MHRLFVLLLPICLLSITEGIRVTTRDCEISGKCRNCGDGRYSYYRCASQADCFPGENCGGSGFCCPNSATFPIVQSSFQNEEASATSAPSATVIPASTGRCPDGHAHDSACQRTEDCPGRHLCVEGKCCAECSLRREQVLRDLPTNDIADVFLPQCESSGRLYRPKQCTPSASHCRCVSAFGRAAPNLSPHAACSDKRRKGASAPGADAARLHAELAAMLAAICADAAPKAGGCPRQTRGRAVGAACACDAECAHAQKCCDRQCIAPEKEEEKETHLTVTFMENSIVDQGPSACLSNEYYVSCYSACEPSCSDMSALPCPSLNCMGGCQCRPGFVRRDTSPGVPCVPRQLCPAFDASSNCADPRRQYLTCGSACPISCDSRNSPRCIERCVSGCFCRIPYILENETDPLHSRCILPAECPLSPPPPLSPLPPGPVTIIHTTPMIPMPTPMAGNRCSDPLKNFLTCGSACPRSCPNLQPTCESACTQGCFCRSPYVLLSGPDSTCVLPQLCPPSEGGKRSCADPRMEWSECGANECAPSCRQPHGGCLSGKCQSGCVCREPYVLSDEPNPRCILPAECAHCEDPKKEFLRCGSSCPVGCDNPSPRSCTPCRSGCFCKNGFVFANSSDWRLSACVPHEECEKMTSTLRATTVRTTVAPTTMTSTASTTTKAPTTSATTAQPLQQLQPTAADAGPSVTTASSVVRLNAARDAPAKLVADQDLMLSAIMSMCPSSTADVSGRPCNFNTDCPSDQLCCRSLVLPLAISPQRCVCPDANAAWSACGSLCPDYCGSHSTPVCSSTCNPGCTCLPGFIRARNDIQAPCVRRDQCPGVVPEPQPVFASANNDPFLSHQIAVAHLYSPSTPVRGRISFSKLSPTTLRVHGLIDNLPNGPHAVVVHQFGDISMNCTRLGPMLLPRSSTSGLLGDVHGKQDGSELLRLLEWTAEDVVGRSVAVYEESTMEWSLRQREKPPLACGTIGVTKFKRK